MRTSAVSRILGLLLMLFSFSLLAPVIVALIYRESTQSGFSISFAIAFSIGALLWIPFSRQQVTLKTRDGFLVTVLFWLVLGLAGAFPFVLADELSMSFTDAVFESISGLTTTGATVITGLDSLPKSILFYRQQLQWLGGIGIVVIALAIMPMLGVGGMQLYRAETPGHAKDTKLTPRITETAKVLFIIYVSLTFACMLAYWAAGMSFFDALGHSFSTVAIGGFSTHDASIGYFNSPLISAICIVFMILAGMNFALHYIAWHFSITKKKDFVLRYKIDWNWRNLSVYPRDSEARFYFNMLAGGVVAVCGYLIFSGYYSTSDGLHHGAFQLVSILTTTGFSTAPFAEWPAFLPVLLLVMSFFGACAGSTGGGLKVARMMIMTKQVLREIQRLIHPNIVHPIKARHQLVPERVADAIWAFFGVYLAVFYALVLLLLTSGLDFTTAWSATAAALNNLGPGLGDVAEHYGNINDAAKWVLSLGMLLGRLEIFTLLVILTPMFWRR